MEGNIVIGSSGRILARSDVLAKARSHKYVKRTGASGSYKYWYRNAKGELFAGKRPAEERGAGLSFDERVLREEADEKKHGESHETAMERMRAEHRKHFGDVGETKAGKVVYDGDYHAVGEEVGAKTRKILDLATERAKGSAEWEAIKPHYEKLPPGHRDRLMARSKERPWGMNFKLGDQVEYEWEGKREVGTLAAIDQPDQQMSRATVKHPDGSTFYVEMPMLKPAVKGAEKPEDKVESRDAAMRKQSAEYLDRAYGKAKPQRARMTKKENKSWDARAATEFGRRK